MFEVEKWNFVCVSSAIRLDSDGNQDEQVRRLFIYKNFIKETQLSLPATGLRGFET